VACNFWQNHILKRIPPEATSTDDVLALYPKASGAEVQADNGVASVIETLKYLKEKEKNLGDTIKKLQFEVQDYMKDADILVDNSGRCLATWKNMNPRITLDTKKLQEEHKDIYQQYVQEKEGSRMFLIK
jgi:predicted phage-related endonuclease